MLLTIGFLCIAIFCIVTSQPSAARPNDSQIIPVVNLANLDFAVTAGASNVQAGDVVPFYLAITNTFSLPLENFVLVTTPPTYTTFSLIESSNGWMEIGTDDTPCIDRSPPGQHCSYMIDSMAANSAITLTFAVQIDQDIPSSNDPVSLRANIYALGAVPEVPTEQPSGQGDNDNGPDAQPTQLLFMPIIE